MPPRCVQGFNSPWKWNGYHQTSVRLITINPALKLNASKNWIFVWKVHSISKLTYHRKNIRLYLCQQVYVDFIMSMLSILIPNLTLNFNWFLLNPGEYNTNDKRYCYQQTDPDSVVPAAGQTRKQETEEKGERYGIHAVWQNYWLRTILIHYVCNAHFHWLWRWKFAALKS